MFLQHRHDRSVISPNKVLEMGDLTPRIQPNHFSPVLPSFLNQHFLRPESGEVGRSVAVGIRDLSGLCSEDDRVAMSE